MGLNKKGAIQMSKKVIINQHIPVTSKPQTPDSLMDDARVKNRISRPSNIGLLSESLITFTSWSTLTHLSLRLMTNALQSTPITH